MHKTLDNSTLYKVTDVSQMIICEGAMPIPKAERKKLNPEGIENREPKIEVEGSGVENKTNVQSKTARQLAKEVSK